MKSKVRCFLGLILWACGSWFPLQAGQSADAGLQLGKTVYTRICMECHGETGQGDGPKAKRMGFRARDFSLAAFKCRCTESGQIPTDADLMRTVTQGLPGSPMVAHEQDTTLEERVAVIAYIKQFSQRFQTEQPGPCLIVPQPSPSTPESVAEGEQIYRVLSCWQCHGSRGRGDGPAAKGLVDDWGEPIKPYNFVVLKKFKCGDTDRDLYRTLHTGMTGSPMPSFTSAFLFGREGVTDFSSYAGQFGAQGAKQTEEFMARQPTQAEIDALSAGAKQALIEKRTWSLIHYLKSLLRR